MNKSKFIVTLGPIGYLPAPGTMGSICALPFILFLQKYNLSIYLAISCLMLLLATWAIHKALPSFKSTDPSEIILDEFVAMFFVFAGMNINIQQSKDYTAIYLIFGLVLFRFFDIFKPFWIKKVECFSGAYGVMLDDFLAAFYSFMCLQVFIYFKRSFFLFLVHLIC